MQIKLFTIPIGDSGTALEDMNRFLRGNKILEVQNQLISNENGAYWCKNFLLALEAHFKLR